MGKNSEDKIYFTVAEDCRTEFTEKKSVFISHVAHVTDESQALSFLSKIRQSFPDARHNVYAYSLYNNGVSVKRFSDDGEPKGTAGMPILEVLEKSGITDVCVVVTRYFGGILLGASGLTRAYSNAASDGLRAAGTKRMVWSTVLSVKVRYDLYGKLPKIFENYPLIQEAPEFGEAVSLKLTVPESELGRLITDIQNATSAQVLIEPLGKGFYDIKGQE